MFLLHSWGLFGIPHFCCIPDCSYKKEAEIVGSSSRIASNLRWMMIFFFLFLLRHISHETDVQETPTSAHTLLIDKQVALPYDKLTNCNWTGRCLLCMVSKWCNAFLMASTRRKMAVCRPDVVSIQGLKTHGKVAHIYFSLLLCCCHCHSVSCLCQPTDETYCFVFACFYTTVNCLLLFKRPPKLQPDQMGRSLKVLQGVAAVGVSLNYQGPLCYVMLRTRGSCLSVCSLSSIDFWLQNLNNFRSPLLQPFAPLFFHPGFLTPLVQIGLFKRKWKLARLGCVLLYAFYSYSSQDSILNKNASFSEASTCH